MPERNTQTGPGLRILPTAPAEHDPVLDAARATVLDFGVRRATLTEVARRAGLSRMTVYRRYADGNELMRAVMSREFGAVLLEAQRRAAGITDGRERVLAGVMGTLEMLIDHPLMLRLLELEPEMLLPYLTDRVGEFQRAGRTALAGWLREAQAKGAVRAGDPERMAATIELAARGPVLAARTLSGEDRTLCLDEVRRMIDAYLAPESG
jgi:AcrR family transcriptional regulator